MNKYDFYVCKAGVSNELIRNKITLASIHLTEIRLVVSQV